MKFVYEEQSALTTSSKKDETVVFALFCSIYPDETVKQNVVCGVV
jgi:hypothetical protein